MSNLDLDDLLASLGSAASAPTPGAPAKTAPAPTASNTGDLDALLASLGGGAPAAPVRATPVAAPAPAPVPVKQETNDLDALLASLGGASTVPAPTPVQAAAAPTVVRAAVPQNNSQGSDLDALLASLGGTAAPAPKPTPAPTPAPAPTVVRAAVPQNQSRAGTDDLDSLLASLGAPAAAPKPTPAPSPQPAPASGNNDLDALLASLGGGAPPPAARPAPVVATPSLTAPSLTAVQSATTAKAANDLDALLGSLTVGSQPSAPAPKSAPADLDSLMASLGPVQTHAHPPSGPTSAADGGLDALLGGLQTEMSTLNASAAGAKGTCAHCRGAIFGEMIKAMNKDYHPEHWVCSQCSQPIGTRSFFDVGGQPQCEPCFSRVGCALCAHCQKPITERCVTALGKKWHPEHFNCTKCLSPFPDGRFNERDGRPWCTPCFSGAFAVNCGKCNQPIVGDMINALGKSWHPDHFTCAFCSCPFTDGQFYPKDNVPYCKTHFLSQSQSLCGGCGQLIVGQVVEAFGKKYHPQHFVCAFCMNPLAGGGYQEKDGRPYCRDCAQRMF